MQLNLFDTDLVWRKRQNFIVLDVLSANSDEKTLLVKDRDQNDETVVLKILNFGDNYCRQNPGQLRKCIEQFKSLNHESFIKIYAYYEEPDFVGYTTPFIKGQKLSDLIKANQFSYEEINHIITKLILAAKYLNSFTDFLAYNSDSKPLCIGPITSDDIIITEEGVPLIFNYQLKEPIGRNIGRFGPDETNLSTIFAYDPLCSRPNLPIPDVDTYAIGIILWELLSGKRRLDIIDFTLEESASNGLKKLKIYSELHKANYFHPAVELESYSNKYNSILNQMLHLDIKKRYKTTEEVISDLISERDFTTTYPSVSEKYNIIRHCQKIASFMKDIMSRRIK